MKISDFHAKICFVRLKEAHTRIISLKVKIKILFNNHC